VSPAETLATPPKRMRAQCETMFDIADVKLYTAIEAELIGVPTTGW
jgi:hypothetical protein